MAATIANEAEMKDSEDLLNHFMSLGDRATPEAKELEELFAQSRSADNIDDLMNEIPDEEEAPEMDERKLMGLFASLNKEGAEGTEESDELRDLLAAWNREGAEEPNEEPEEDEDEDVNGDEDKVDDGLGDDDEDEEDESDEFDPDDASDEDEELDGDDLFEELEDGDDEIPDELLHS